MKKALFSFILFSINAPLQSKWHTIYAHGIVDGPSQVERFAQAIAIPNPTALSFADTTQASDWGFNRCISSVTYAILGKNVNRSQMYMGQGSDITALQKTVLNLPENDQIVLYGCSRGASTIINFIAEFNPVNVQALILDAAVADMPATIAPILAKCGINPKHACTVFTKLFPAYPKNSTAPIQVLKQIQNKNLPILLIHSKKDQQIPVQNSYMIYQELKKQGFTNVNLIILPSGLHSYLLQDEAIRPIYLQAVHQFYKKNGLPYNAQWTSNVYDLTNCQPDAHDINASIIEYEQNIIQTYARALKRNALTITAISTLVVAYIIQKFS